MIKEVIVVEGKEDTVAIQRSVQADTIETGGSALSSQTLNRILLAKERRGVIIFTDPDFAGERIRKRISEKIPGCKHAFLSEKEAMLKGDIGVENASKTAIIQALSNVKTEVNEIESEIDWDDLLKAGLTLHPEACDRRKKVGEQLGIGCCNAKQFYKRCRIFQIKKEEWQRALAGLEAEKKS